MRSPEDQETERRKQSPPPLNGVNGNDVGGRGEQQQRQKWIEESGAAVSSPEAQSRGNKGNGSGHLRSSSTSTETHDANGHNMAQAAAIVAPVVVEPKANQSARGGPTAAQQQQLKERRTGHEHPSSPVNEKQQQQLNGDQSNPSQHNHQVHEDVNQKLEFTFANFDPRDFSSGGGADRLYLADDDHYSHEIKKNNALNQKFNNHNYYGHGHSTQGAAHYAGYDATAATVPGDDGTAVGVDEVDSLIMGFVDGSAHSVSGMIGRPGSSGGMVGGSSSVLIDKDLINDRKKPKPVAIGDSKFPPVNSKG